MSSSDTRKIASFRVLKRNDTYLKLTKRQSEVKALIIQGLTNKQIGFKLGIKEKSVKCVVSQLFRKEKVKTRVELAVKCLTPSAPEVVQLELPAGFAE